MFLWRCHTANLQFSIRAPEPSSPTKTEFQFISIGYVRGCLQAAWQNIPMEIPLQIQTNLEVGQRENAKSKEKAAQLQPTRIWAACTAIWNIAVGAGSHSALRLVQYSRYSCNPRYFGGRLTQVGIWELCNGLLFSSVASFGRGMCAWTMAAWSFPSFR